MMTLPLSFKRTYNRVAYMASGWEGGGETCTPTYEMCIMSVG